MCKRCLPQVATQVKWARSNGALPPPDPDDLQLPAQQPDADEIFEPRGKRAVVPRGASSFAEAGRTRDGRAKTAVSVYVWSRYFMDDF